MNPFATMGLESSDRETPTATFAKLRMFRAKAIEMGLPSLATAALIAWEWLQREVDIFATFEVGHYRPKDVLVATIQLMPQFIDKPLINGRRIYVMANETTIGENFAERWNSEPARATAFYDWHAKALSHFEPLPNLQGLDVIAKNLEKSLGGSVVRKVMDTRTEAISQARIGKKL